MKEANVVGHIVNWLKKGELSELADQLETLPEELSSRVFIPIRNDIIRDVLSSNEDELKTKKETLNELKNKKELSEEEYHEWKVELEREIEEINNLVKG